MAFLGMAPSGGLIAVIADNRAPARAMITGGRDVVFAGTLR